MCVIFQEHHRVHGFRSPGKLVISMFNNIYDRYGHAADDDPVPENSNVGIPSPGHISEEVVDPMAHEYEAPMPAGATNTTVEDVDPKIPAATTVNVEDVDPRMPAATKINDEEVFVTEKVDSDNAYNVCSSENCAVSQATVIIPSKDS